jgi:hypothetical protein
MSNANARLSAVIAALEKISDHLQDTEATEDIAVSTYNRWIGMLDGVVDGNWKSLGLDGDFIPASEMAMHVDAAIAFLEEHRDA